MVIEVTQIYYNDVVYRVMNVCIIYVYIYACVYIYMCIYM